MKPVKIGVLSAAILATVAGCARDRGIVPEPAVPVEVADPSLELTRRAFLVDSHIDYPERAKPLEDVTIGTSGDFDYPRAKAGGLDLAFIVSFVSAEDAAAGTVYSKAEERIDLARGMSTAHPDKFALVTSPKEASDAVAAGKLAIAIGIENGDALESRLDRLAYFRDRGVSYLTLTHAEDNSLCDSSTGSGSERRWGGLSQLGREAIKEMNRLGIMVDLAHATDEALYQAVELSSAPVIVSHTGARARTPGFERNISDEAMKAVADKGGVIQMAFGSLFVNDAYRSTYSNADLASVADVAASIQHAVSVAGIDHVGIGSDFDGVGPSLPRKLKDVSMYPNLVRELIVLGYGEKELDKILGGNFMRVWDEVLAAARPDASSTQARP